MRESTASSTIFKIVLAFTFLFAGFLSIAIVYNRAFRLKNGSLAMIEKYEGNVESSVQLINNYLKSSGYKTMAKCDKNEYGVSKLTSTSLTKASGSEKYYYCLSQECSKKTCQYNIKLFFKFELPFLGEIFTYKVTGKSKLINYFNDKQKLK